MSRCPSLPPVTASADHGRRAAVSRLFVALLLALTCAGCGRGSSPQAAKATGGGATEAPAVRVQAAVERTLVRSVTVTGTLAAQDQVAMSFKVPGRIEHIAVDLGSRVAAGQVVARLAPVDFQLQVQQAEAALQQARARLGLDPTGSGDHVDPESTPLVRQARAVLDEAKLRYDRVKTFVDRGISARSELDTANAALKVADGRYADAIEEVHNRQAVLAQRRSELELARQQLTDANLLAPFPGTIRERTASAGQFVAAGAPIATLVRMHPLRLQADVPEKDANSLAVGQQVRVRVEGDARNYAGRVVRVSPAIDEQSRSLRIEAEVGNEDGTIRPGSFATADVILEAQAPAIVIPATAIVTFAGVEKVLTVGDGKVIEKRVSLGRREGDAVEVLQGLAIGDRVIVAPGNLVDGDSVRITS